MRRRGCRRCEACLKVLMNTNTSSTPAEQWESKERGLGEGLYLAPCLGAQVLSRLQEAEWHFTNGFVCLCSGVRRAAERFTYINWSSCLQGDYSLFWDAIPLLRSPHMLLCLTYIIKHSQRCGVLSSTLMCSECVYFMPNTVWFNHIKVHCKLKRWQHLLSVCTTF